MNKRKTRMKYRKHLPGIKETAIQTIAMIGTAMVFWVIIVLITV